MSKYKTKYIPTHPKASSSGCVYEHVLIAEKSLGRYMPNGSEVHHIDYNPKNNSNKNLVICENHAYHKLLHARTEIVVRGGNPNTHAICSKCLEIIPISGFNKYKSSIGYGIQKYCRTCQKEHYRGYQRKR